MPASQYGFGDMHAPSSAWCRASLGVWLVNLTSGASEKQAGLGLHATVASKSGQLGPRSPELEQIWSDLNKTCLTPGRILSRSRNFSRSRAKCGRTQHTWSAPNNLVEIAQFCLNSGHMWPRFANYKHNWQIVANTLPNLDQVRPKSPPCGRLRTPNLNKILSKSPNIIAIWAECGRNRANCQNRTKVGPHALPSLAASAR